jgi:hypothetical protein
VGKKVRLGKDKIWGKVRLGKIRLGGGIVKLGKKSRIGTKSDNKSDQ